MPDIAMCQNEGCPSKNTCYRHEAIPSKWRQSFMDFIPMGDKCGDYIEVRSKSEFKRLDSQTSADGVGE